MNLGVAGYSTDQALLLYQRLGPSLQAQRVVLLLFDNDVWFNSVTVEHRAPKPAFALTPTGLQLLRHAQANVSPPSPATKSSMRGDSLRLCYQLCNKPPATVSPFSTSPLSPPSTTNEAQNAALRQSYLNAFALD